MFLRAQRLQHEVQIVTTAIKKREEQRKKRNEEREERKGTREESREHPRGVFRGRRGDHQNQQGGGGTALRCEEYYDLR